MGKHGTQGTHSDVVHTDTSTRPAVREVVCGLRSVRLHRDRLNGWPYLFLKLKSGRLGDLPAFARRPPILYPHFHASFTHSEKAVLVLFVLLCQNQPLRPSNGKLEMYSLIVSVSHCQLGGLLAGYLLGKKNNRQWVLVDGSF